MNNAGDPSAALSSEVVTVPEVHVRATGTVATLFGMKSLLTAIVSLLRVLVIVQVPPSGTFAQLVWFAV